MIQEVDSSDQASSKNNADIELRKQRAYYGRAKFVSMSSGQKD